MHNVQEAFYLPILRRFPMRQTMPASGPRPLGRTRSLDPALMFIGLKHHRRGA